jgi:hypothetical protein
MSYREAAITARDSFVAVGALHAVSSVEAPKKIEYKVPSSTSRTLQADALSGE